MVIKALNTVLSVASRAAVVALAACLVGLPGTPARAQVDGGRLPTRWDKDVSPTAPLPDYPRPQMVRPRWQSLNGPWQYTLTNAGATIPPAAYDGKILVPYPYEAALSGVGKASPTDRRVWYRRTFTVPAAWRGQRTLLHFGAVNWDSTARVNGHVLGEHKGGYDAFDYDITDALKPGINTIVVSAWNPLRHDTPDAQVLGKHRLPLSAAGQAALRPGANVLAVHCHQSIGGQVIDVGLARH